MSIHTKLNVTQAKSEISSVDYTSISKNQIMCTITHQCGHVFTGIAHCYALDQFSIKLGQKNAYDHAFEAYLDGYSFLQRVREFEKNGTTALINSNTKTIPVWYGLFVNMTTTYFECKSFEEGIFLQIVAYTDILTMIYQLQCVDITSHLWEENMSTLKNQFSAEIYAPIINFLEIAVNAQKEDMV